MKRVTVQQIGPDIPEWFPTMLQDVVRRCLAIKADERPTASEVMQVRYRLPLGLYSCTFPANTVTNCLCSMCLVVSAPKIIMHTINAYIVCVTAVSDVMQMLLCACCTWCACSQSGKSQACVRTASGKVYICIKSMCCTSCRFCKKWMLVKYPGQSVYMQTAHLLGVLLIPSIPSQLRKGLFRKSGQMPLTQQHQSLPRQLRWQLNCAAVYNMLLLGQHCRSR